NQPGPLGAKLESVDRLPQPAVNLLSDDLRRRIAQLRSAEQLAAFLKEVLPKDSTAKTAAAENLEASLWQGLFKSVPGGAYQIPEKVLKVREQVSANRYIGTGIQISQDPTENLTRIVHTFPGGPAPPA